MDHQSNGFSPTIMQILIWTFFASLWGAVFLFIGDMLSEKPSSSVNSEIVMQKLDVAKVNSMIDSTLANSESALKHDHALLHKLDLGVVGTCLASLLVGFFVIRNLRRKRKPLTMGLSILLIFLFGVPPVVAIFTLNIMEDRVLQSDDVAKALSNSNTKPAVVTIGTDAVVSFPTNLQSFFGYYEAVDVAIDTASVFSSSSDEIPITLVNPELIDYGRKPAKDDLIPVMESVYPHVRLHIPNQDNLIGAFIDLSISGTLRVVSRGSKVADTIEKFSSRARFRIAKTNEEEFRNKYEMFSSHITKYNWFTLITLLILIVGFFLFGPKACKNCGELISLHTYMNEIAGSCEKCKPKNS